MHVHCARRYTRPDSDKSSLSTTIHDYILTTTATTMKKTYGRKNSRRVRPDTPDVEVVLSPPRKRPRIEVEIVQPQSSAHLSPPKVTSPVRRSTTMPDVGSISSTPSKIRTPTKPARDLSTLFSASPHRTPNTPGRSVGVVKRMLSRSRTESFIDNNAGHNVRSVTRASWATY